MFRVVRVSGTIRKAEEEAIQRARNLILQARRQMDQQSESTLDNILGMRYNHSGDSTTKDNLMVDREDSDEEDVELSESR